jgi:hypothetical protein
MIIPEDTDGIVPKRHGIHALKGSSARAMAEV